MGWIPGEPTSDATTRRASEVNVNIPPNIPAFLKPVQEKTLKLLIFIPNGFLQEVVATRMKRVVGWLGNLGGFSFDG